MCECDKSRIGKLPLYFAGYYIVEKVWLCAWIKLKSTSSYAEFAVRTENCSQRVRVRVRFRVSNIEYHIDCAKLLLFMISFFSIRFLFYSSHPYIHISVFLSNLWYNSSENMIAIREYKRISANSILPEIKYVRAKKLIAH